MSSWVKPGAKCIFVDHTKGINPNPVSRKGDICEILEVSNIQGFLVVRAREINGRWVHGYWEWAKASRFRPLITKTQEEDVALFQSLLSPNLVDKLDLLAERMNDLASE